jgi:uncharacterized protein
MSDVPCNGCTLCCREEAIFLHPEDGDVVESYDVQEMDHPLKPGRAFMLKKGADGNCIYLKDGGCSIYERRPIICRKFDCRKLFLRFGRAERRLMVKRGMADQDVFDRGRELLPTLHSGK